MKKYMLLAHDSETNVTHVVFSDDYLTIERSQMDAECGLGCYCEVYERGENGYEFLFD